jgi:hypothetical protein
VLTSEKNEHNLSHHPDQDTRNDLWARELAARHCTREILWLVVTYASRAKLKMDLARRKTVVANSTGRMSPHDSGLVQIDVILNRDHTDAGTLLESRSYGGV